MQDSLARFIDGVRVLEPVAGRVSHERLPDGRTSLVFRRLEPSASGTGGPPGDLCIAGPRTRAQFKDVSGVTRALILELKPGWAAALLGVSAHELADHIVHLEDAWGSAGRALLAELLATRSTVDALDRIAVAIAHRAQHGIESSSARLARRAVSLLEGDEVRVESVADRLGVTARHLRRAFTESVGIGPKEFARSVRLRRAVGMTSTTRDWGRIAADAGYYDQAHLIADFRDLVGLTPAAYVKGTEGRRGVCRVSGSSRAR